MKLPITLYASVLILCTSVPLTADTHTVASPDGSIVATVQSGEAVLFSVEVDANPVVLPSPIALLTSAGSLPKEGAAVLEQASRSVSRALKPVVAEKFATIRESFNELTLQFEDGISLVVRAYDNGVAYRFETSLEGELLVLNEKAGFSFSGETVRTLYPREDGFMSHNERSYIDTTLDTLPGGTLASLPIYLDVDGIKVVLMESSLEDYPGMWVRSAAGNRLQAVFPARALESALDEGSDRNMPVTRRAGDIARTSGEREFPWRVLALGRNDGDLITNQLVYLLGGECRIEDTGWIQPGKVAWDWWNANNIYGVDFKSGVNTETYRYYIDFASSHGLEYVVLDEGWYVLGDVLDIAPGMDVRGLIDYGKSKNVGIILWVVWKTLDDKLEEALDAFAEWGAVGIKVDFMQRDDQDMVNYYWKVAEAAARRRLLVDFHGCYKPAGIRRAYPNVITREGVKGLEHNKWSNDVTPTHNLILPFVRMVPGPMDYTPGAMKNAQTESFRHIFYQPMSMGTRVHQLAMYVIYESPVQMLADNPSNYLREPECSSFIARIPTTWDDTRVLAAAAGRYLVLARRHGDNWYLGAMANEDGYEATVDLSFLGEGTYSAEIMADGINADRHGSDYKKMERILTREDPLQLKLAPGGGWAAIFTPVRD